MIDSPLDLHRVRRLAKFDAELGASLGTGSHIRVLDIEIATEIAAEFGIHLFVVGEPVDGLVPIEFVNVEKL